MNTEEKIEAARRKLDEGDALFKAKNYARDSKRYGQVTIMYILLKLIYKITLFILRVLSCLFS